MSKADALPEWVQDVRELIRSMGAQKALVEVQSWQHKFPKDYRVHCALGQVLCKLGRWNDAVKSYDLSLSLGGSKDPDVWDHKGFAVGHLGKGHDEEAIECFEKALSISNQFHKSAWNNKAFTLRRMRKYDEALEAVNRALEIDPNFGTAKANQKNILHYVRSNKKSGQMTKSTGNGSMSSSSGPKSGVGKRTTVSKPIKLTYSSVLSNSSTGPTSQELTKANKFKTEGAANEKKGKFQSALGKYDAALRLNKDDPEALFHKGYCLSQMRSHQKAIEAYDEALGFDGDNIAEIWYHMGFSYGQLGNAGQALYCYDECIATDSNHKFAWNEKGALLFGQGKVSLAIEAFEEAMSIDNKYTVAHDNLVFALDTQNESKSSNKSGNPKQQSSLLGSGSSSSSSSLSSMSSSGSLFSHSGSTLSSTDSDGKKKSGGQSSSEQDLDAKVQHLAELGRELELQGEYQRAHSKWDQIMKMGFDSQPDIWMHKGICLANMNAHRKAVSSFDLAMKHSQSDNAELHYHKAFSLQELKDYKRAIEEYDLCLSLDDQNKLAYNQKGVLFYTQGDQYEALKCFDLALGCDPQYTTASTNRAVVVHALSMSPLSGSVSTTSTNQQNANARGSLLTNGSSSMETNMGTSITGANVGGGMMTKSSNIAGIGSNENVGSVGLGVSGQSGKQQGTQQAQQVRVNVQVDNETQTINKIASLIKKKLYQDSVDLCQSAIEAFEDPLALAIVYDKQGYALSKLHRCEDAIESYQKSIDLNNQDPEVWNNMGFALQILKRYDDSVGAFERSISLDNGNKVVWNSLGQVLRAMKQYQDAIDCFNNALDIDADFFFAKRNKRQTEKLHQKQLARQPQQVSQVSPGSVNNNTTTTTISQANSSGINEDYSFLGNGPEQPYPLINMDSSNNGGSMMGTMGTMGTPSFGSSMQQQQPSLFQFGQGSGFDLSTSNSGGNIAMNYSSFMNNVNGMNGLGMVNTPPGWDSVPSVNSSNNLNSPMQPQSQNGNQNQSQTTGMGGPMWGFNNYPESVPSLIDSGLWGQLHGSEEGKPTG